jgi:hypothetical protein
MWGAIHQDARRTSPDSLCEVSGRDLPNGCRTGSLSANTRAVDDSFPWPDPRTFISSQLEIVLNAEYIAAIVLTSFAILVNYPVIQLDTHGRFQLICGRSAHLEGDSGL